jgi:predicted alpha/beta hydrolase family esterase
LPAERELTNVHASVALAASSRYPETMKSSDTTILVIPGYRNSGPDHWQSRWQAKLSSARRVEQADWSRPERALWTAAVGAAVNESKKPVVLVAHSLGIAASIHAIPEFRRPVIGGFFVAPPDLETPGLAPPDLAAFGPWPRDPLPFPSIVVASRNDPYCAFEITDDLAASWGALLLDAGEAGHINTDSGYGPWPEGSVAFAKFLSRL